MPERKTYTIDAKGKSFGRLAVRIASLLRGKNKPDYVPYKDMGDSVVVKNIKDLKLNHKKIEKKIYYRHSGYPGGLKEVTLKQLFQEFPERVLRKAVWGMLPKNKLRAKQIKRLKIDK